MEEWRTVVYDGEVYDNYEVSNDGHVRSLNYHGKIGNIRELKFGTDKDGYLQVKLSKNGKAKTCKVHRMVAYVWIPNDDPVHKTEINHKNELKHDCRVENLEWCDRSKNINHATRSKRARHTMRKHGKKVMGKSLTENKVIIFQSARQANKLGFNHSAIGKCCNGKLKQHKDYTWRYIE